MLQVIHDKSSSNLQSSIQMEYRCNFFITHIVIVFMITFGLGRRLVNSRLKNKKKEATNELHTNWISITWHKSTLQTLQKLDVHNAT